MKKKIGLVIQGPLLSIGRSGGNLHKSPEELRKSGGVIEFDCRDNIQRIVSEFGYLFDEIVVSTWDNEVKEGDGWQGVRLVSQPDPGGIKRPGHYKDNNKFRQFISTLRGLQELEKSGVDYVVKTRTDIYLDFDKLLESFFNEIKHNKNPKLIGATVVHRPTFLLHDLYFISTLKAMKGFCEAILNYDRFEFIPSVHREMVLKHAYHEYRREIGVPDWAYFPFSPPSGVAKATRKIFDYMFNHAYFSINPDVFRGTLWRGEHYEREHVASLVEAGSFKRRYNIPALISIDWKRYYHFREQFFGQQMSLFNKIKASLGEWGWDVWHWVRRIVRMVR